jgi:hypothetical protein
MILGDYKGILGTFSFKEFSDKMNRGYCLKHKRIRIRMAFKLKYK